MATPVATSPRRAATPRRRTWSSTSSTSPCASAASSSLNDVTMQMRRGEILAVIGPNGAGKTSLFNSLTGVYTPQQGRIRVAARAGDAFDQRARQEDAHGQPPRRRAHVPEHPAVPGADRARERQDRHRDAAAVGPDRGHARPAVAAARGEGEHPRRRCELLREVRLADRANELAGSLAYGEQRRLEIARALGTNPGVLLLDEPAAGTNPAEKRDLAELISRINTDRNMSVLLIEHDMKLVMSIAHRIVVLNFGEKIAEGTPQEIQKDPVVVAAYLGTSAEERRGQRPARAAPARPRCHPRRARASRSSPVSETPNLATGGGSPQRKPMLEVDDIEVRYGAIAALKGISFSVREGEIVALLGANGAGKTTTQKTVSGMMRPVAGLDHLRRPAHRRHPGARAHQPRHLPRARGPARLPADDGRGEPRDGRLPVQGGRPRRPRPRARAVPAAARAASSSRPARCPAASSRCWPSAAR